MTPKEEALELFNAMKGFRVKHTHSKKCAKVAVDKLIAELMTLTPVPALERRVDDLVNVKIEIDKL